jgi:PTS system nitrogen regulatory IIA component
VLAPSSVVGLHLKLLAHVSRLLKDEAFRHEFLTAAGQDGLWSLLQTV